MTIDMDEIYRKLPLQEIPWNVKEPPKALVDLVEGGKVRPCKAIDFGCGAGNYAVYLAGKGFDVTGIDISPTAIHLAGENAKKVGVRCRFIAADVLGDLKEVDGAFDFAYDWELLHHLFPEQRKLYAANVHRKLNPGARYLSLCFSEQDSSFGGSGKYRETPIGTRLYFSSEGEIRDLFKPYFKFLQLKTIEVRGKGAPHQAVYAFMERS